MSGGGPDGLALDEAGNLAVAHVGRGAVWLFSRLGEPLRRINSCRGLRTTNVTYGGLDGRDLFVTEAESGAILRARPDVPGRRMFSHAWNRRVLAGCAAGTLPVRFLLECLRN